MFTTAVLLVAGLGLIVYGLWILPSLGPDGAPRFLALHGLARGGLAGAYWRGAVPAISTDSLVLVTLVLIVLTAFALRVVNLVGIPPGFFCDEASNGLDAYFLGHTLRDQHGAFLPAYLQALGDWRGALFAYWDAPFVALLGLNEAAVRVGAAVAGTATVLLTYVFVVRAYGRTLALTSAVLLTVSPWGLIVSREGFEAVMLPLVTAVCLTFLFVGLDRPAVLPFAYVFAAVGIYSYVTGQLFFPLLCLAWSAIYASVFIRRRRTLLPAVPLGLVLLIPAVRAMITGTFFARMRQVAAPSLSLHDRAVSFVGNYWHHVQVVLLLRPLDDAVLRSYVRGFGFLYGIEVPFLVVGLAVMAWRHRRADMLMLAWFVLYPIPTSLVSGPEGQRSIAGLIVLQIIVGQGLLVVIHEVGELVGSPGARRRMLTASWLGLGAALCLATAQFIHAYFVTYPTYASGWWGWQWGAAPIVSYFEGQRGNYEHLIMSSDFNAADELLRFYTELDPGACASCRVVNVIDPAGFHAAYSPSARELWAVPPNELAQSALASVRYRVISQIDYPAGGTAFLFVATGPGT